ncbi:hypothetical protein DDT48_20935 [Mycobacteroides abscessus]|uniref:hypothetical protein n=1 Tax=Mycobacteroides abscessus TaxID=36809 RepID=UPI000C2696F1|nr:hypothetical protein [Mycobacteroides abscessus]AWG51607.1 hypothetical protein DDT48_20935 [Mycobacteroides abscessus]
MTDPSIEAAQKVWERHEPPYRSDDLVAAARKALKPIRDKWAELLMPYATRLVDPEATGAIKVLEAFAPLIFTTEELNQ